MGSPRASPKPGWKRGATRPMTLPEPRPPRPPLPPPLWSAAAGAPPPTPRPPLRAPEPARWTVLTIRHATTRLILSYQLGLRDGIDTHTLDGLDFDSEAAARHYLETVVVPAVAH